jgi:hypothetical protein
LGLTQFTGKEAIVLLEDKSVFWKSSLALAGRNGELSPAW